jgi:hypothetical protein
MHSAKVDIFFSCSFADVDKDVNDLFGAICRALNLSPTNISTGSPLIPPAVAKKKIESSQALVAICTKREELMGGGFVMPDAVHDEISFAIGKDIPVLMIVEAGVSLKGFKRNFGTQLEFTRPELSTPAFLGRAIEAIHDLKLLTLGPEQSGVWHAMHEAYAEHVKHLVELTHTGKDFLWRYSTSKKLIYTNPSRRPLPSGFWATNTKIPPGSPPISWTSHLDEASSGIQLTPTIEKQTNEVVEASISLAPHPVAGDIVAYSTRVESRYLNAVWLNEAPEDVPAIHLAHGDYKCADGLIFLHRTHRAVVEFRFPKEAGLTLRDVHPFVASHTVSFDFEVESELARTRHTADDFGGTLVFRLEIESPLPAHMYGVAWNPRERPS